MPELRGNSDAGWAVWGASNGGTGVVGTADGQIGVGIYGESTRNNGVWGKSGSGTGVFGESNTGVGVVGHSRNSYGVRAQSDAATHFALEVIAGTLADGTRGLAAVFDGHASVAGNLHVTGNLSVSGNKSFKIDHPQDPQNKYLLHNAVESSERKNVYDGVAYLDEDGSAWVELPEWFEALNEDLCYQLTAVGGAAPELHVAEEVSETRFRIAGGQGGMKVCWQLTGTRKDPWAAANPFEVEQEKSQEERGRYLQPDLYNAPAEQSVMMVPDPEETLQQMSQQPPPPPQAPGMPLGFGAPGFASSGEENRRQIDELREQIEELRRRL